jgi:hypothetical protein
MPFFIDATTSASLTSVSPPFLTTFGAGGGGVSSGWFSYTAHVETFKQAAVRHATTVAL